MLLICAIDIIVIIVLVQLTVKKGLENALPFFVFVVIFVPMEAQLPFPGFVLTTQRVALCTVGILFMCFSKRNEAAALVKKTPLKIAIILHVVWCAIATANSIVPVDSLKKMIAITAEYYLMYWIIVKTVSKPETIQKILTAMVAAVSLACVFGSYEAYTEWNISQWFPSAAYRFGLEGAELLGRGYRATGTFGNYSLFGAAIAFAIPEAFYLLAVGNGWARKLWLWIGLMLMFLCIYKTSSRGPWLTVIMGFCLLFVLGQQKTRKHILAICALVVLVLVTRPGVYDTVKNIYVGTLATNNPDSQLATSYEYRYALMHIAGKALSRNVGRELWGYGLESFFSLHLVGPFYRNPEYRFVSCDSSWVEAAVETGYVGLLILAFLLFKPVLVSLRNLRALPKPYKYAAGILLINLLQYYFMMTNVALYAWGQTGYMLWTWIALIMICATLRPDGEAIKANEEEEDLAKLSAFATA